MSTSTTNQSVGATLISSLRYDDAPAAIQWLCEALGFKEHLVVPGENGTIAHAQLIYGNGMIMLGSARDDEFGRLVQPPRGNPNTQSVYVIVENVDAHHDRAKLAGAEIILPPEDQDHGGRLYTCRDPEGHVWNFGDYNPWVEPA